MAGNDDFITVVADAGPLIHLDECRCLDLLEDLSPVLVPKAVMAEVLRHRPRDVWPWLQVVPDPVEGLATEQEAILRMLPLDAGEMASLRVAAAHDGCLLLTDDMAARLAAEKLNILARGTLGVIIRSIRTRRRTKHEVLALLRSLPMRSSLHLKTTLLEEVLRQVQELGE